MKKVRNFLVTLLIFIVVNGILSFVFYHFVLNSFSGNHLEPVDAGIVFFHDLNENSQLSNQTLDRLKTSLTLYKVNRIKNILCVGGSFTNIDLIGSELMSEWLIKQNVPQNVVFHDSFSRDSRSNIKAANDFIQQQQWNQVYLISSPMHLFRLKKIASKELTINLYYQSYFETYKTDYSIFNKWIEIQHELIAWMMLVILPDNTYEKIIAKRR